MGLRARPLNIVSSQVAHTNIANDLGATAMAISSKVVARKRNYEPKLAFRHTWMDRAGRPQLRAEVTPSSKLAAPGRGVNKRGKMGGAGPNRSKSLLRASQHTRYSSCPQKSPIPTSPTVLAREQSLFRIKPAPENVTTDPNVGAGPYGETGEAGRSFLGGENLILDTSYPQQGSKQAPGIERHWPES